MNNDLISREALIEAVEHLYEYAELDEVLDVIKNAPTVKPQKVAIIPQEIIEKLALCVVDTINNIDWDKAIEAYKARPQGKWINREAISNTIFPFWERYECNQCHKYNGYSNFCPNCGADMRGGAE